MRTRQVGYLGDSYSVDPLVEGSDIITTQVLDVLRFLLDLGVLRKQMWKR